MTFREAEHVTTLTLAEGATPADRDFELTWKPKASRAPAGAKFGSARVAAAPADEGEPAERAAQPGDETASEAGNEWRRHPGRQHLALIAVPQRNIPGDGTAEANPLLGRVGRRRA